MVHINTFELMEHVKIVKVIIRSKMIKEVAKHQNVVKMKRLRLTVLVWHVMITLNYHKIGKVVSHLNVMKTKLLLFMVHVEIVLNYKDHLKTKRVVKP